MPAAGDFAVYNEISAAYFTLNFIDNKYEVSASSNSNRKNIPKRYEYTKKDTNVPSGESSGNFAYIYEPRHGIVQGLGPRKGLNITCENEPRERSAVIAFAVTNKMFKRARGGDSTATQKISKFFRKFSCM